MSHWVEKIILICDKAVPDSDGLNINQMLLFNIKIKLYVSFFCFLKMLSIRQ